MCNALTFDSLDLESSFLVCWLLVHLQNGQVNLVHQGRRVKVKVTRAQKREISSSHPSETDMGSLIAIAVTRSPFHSFKVRRYCAATRAATAGPRRLPPGPSD